MKKIAPRSSLANRGRYRSFNAAMATSCGEPGQAQSDLSRSFPPALATDVPRLVSAGAYAGLAGVEPEIASNAHTASKPNPPRWVNSRQRQTAPLRASTASGTRIHGRETTRDEDEDLLSADADQRVTR